MATNENKIRERYSNGKEDTRAEWSRASGLEFYYTKKILAEYINTSSNVIELGCATGYYAMHFADKCHKYLGIDITPENIAIFNDKITSASLKNVSAKLGDATNLDSIDSNNFDVVLCLGPMYHLPPEERELVFAECKRICKKGGIIAVAYISPYGAYLKGILRMPEYYPNQKANEFILKKGIDDLRPELFFFTKPEDIAKMARSHNLSIIKNVGVDYSFNDIIVNEMTEEQFKAYMVLLDYMTESESCTGLSNHSLLICKK